MRPEKQSLKSAKSPEPIGIAAYPRNRHGWGIQFALGSDEMLRLGQPQSQCVMAAPSWNGGCPSRTLTRRGMPHLWQLFSPMTSFTHCSGTTFTLQRARSAPGRDEDGVEDDGRAGTPGAICCGSHAEGLASAAYPL